MTTPDPGYSPDLLNALSGIDVAGTLAGLGAGTTSTKNDPLIYFGRKDSTNPAVGESRLGFGSTTGDSIASDAQREYVPLSTAKLEILKWSDAEQQILAERLVAAGMLDENYTRPELEAAWGGLVEKAAKYQSVGKNLTPWDVIDRDAGVNPVTGDPSRPTTRTVVQKQATLSNPDQAYGLLNSALSSALGRRATQQEQDDFLVALNDAQRKAPSVSTTTYGGTTANSTVAGTSTGGVDEGAFAQKYAQGGDHATEYGHYQAATTYADALFQALKSPV